MVTIPKKILNKLECLTLAIKDILDSQNSADKTFSISEIEEMVKENVEALDCAYDIRWPMPWGHSFIIEVIIDDYNFEIGFEV